MRCQRPNSKAYTVYIVDNIKEYALWYELTFFLKQLNILKTVNYPTELFWVLMCKNSQFCIKFIKYWVNGTFGTYYEKLTADMAGSILNRSFFRKYSG